MRESSQNNSAPLEKVKYIINTLCCSHIHIY